MLECIHFLLLTKEYVFFKAYLKLFKFSILTYILTFNKHSSIILTNQTETLKFTNLPVNEYSDFWGIDLFVIVGVD